MNEATSDPPKPNPMSTRVASPLKSTKITVAPIRPKPMTNMPDTVPAWNATSSASLNERVAAYAVRTFPRTAKFIPTYPAP